MVRRLFLTVAGFTLVIDVTAFLSRPSATAAVSSAHQTYLSLIFISPPATATPTPSPIPTNTPTPVSTATRTPSPLPTATKTPAPTNPQIAHTSLYVDSANYTHVLGEVINYSSAPIYSASVTVTYYNSNGSTAGTEQIYTYTTMILPGERSPFDGIAQPQPGWASYKLILTYSGGATLTFSHAFGFSGQSQWSDSFEQHYAGTITNMSGQAQDFPAVVLTGYDASGNVVLADFTYATGLSDDTINAGQSAPYELDEPLDRASLVTSTAFVAEGWH